MKRGMTIRDLRRLEVLAREGWGIAAMARQLDHTPRCIRYWLHKEHIPCGRREPRLEHRLRYRLAEAGGAEERLRAIMRQLRP